MNEEREMPVSPEHAWTAVLGQLEMEMARGTFNTFLKGTEFLSYDEENGVLKVGVRTAYALDWIEARLTSIVSRLLVGMLNRGDVSVEFEVSTNADLPEVDEDLPLFEEKDTAPRDLAPNATLNPNLTFATFVDAPETRLAFAAARAVSEKLGERYNPLYLYGLSGTGKTHLLHAIGNAAVALGLNVLYVTAEEFTNDLIVAIRTHQTQALRDKYRTVEVLLMDEVDFLAGKEKSTEEFFHTFNELVGKNRQVVIASELAPRDLKKFEVKMRSRFEMGLVADLQMLGYESRLAILQFKNEQHHLKVSDEVILEIARLMKRNVRALEGALRRVSAYASLQGIVVKPDMAENMLIDLIPEPEAEPDRIIDAVSALFGLSREELISRSRQRRVTLPRQIAMYLLRSDTQLSMPQIGEELGGRDHTTVMYGVDKIADLLKTDTALQGQVANIRAQSMPRSLAA